MACIYVLAGTNGAGKSSVAGERLIQKSTRFFDPDEAATLIRSANPAINQNEANSAAWHEGKRLLQRAISGRLNFAFETTLGGRTFTSLLESALSAGIEVRIWYVGLASAELHIKRVKSRVARGGHDIPEAQIRSRYDSSRLNLIHLLPRLTELSVFDNTYEADPSSGATPQPELILHMSHGKIVYTCELDSSPDWAKPILAAALNSPHA
jgi:predicted ABC-type ATPase